MKESIHELVKRLNSIHFTLMIAIGVVALPFFVSNQTKIEKARTQLGIIQRLIQNWDEDWLLEYAEETVDNSGYTEKLMPNLIYLEEEEAVVELNSQTGKSYILNDSYQMELLNYHNDFSISDSLYNLFSDFKEYWNTIRHINKIEVLLPLPKVAVYRMTDFTGDWPDGCNVGVISSEEKGFVEYEGLFQWTPYFGDPEYDYNGERYPLEDLSRHFRFSRNDLPYFEPGEEVEIQILTGGDTCTIDMMTSMAMNDDRDFWMPVMMDPERYTVFYSVPEIDYDVYGIPFERKEIPFNPLERLKYFTGEKDLNLSSFENDFPELNEITKNYSNLSLATIVDVIDSQYKNDNGGGVSAFGASIPFRILRIMGLFVIFGMQLYYFLHLDRLQYMLNRYDEELHLNWIALYPSRMSKGAFVVSTFVFPAVLAVAIIVFILQNNYHLAVLAANILLAALSLVVALKSLVVYQRIRRRYMEVHAV